MIDVSKKEKNLHDLKTFNQRENEVLSLIKQGLKSEDDHELEHKLPFENKHF